MSVQEETPLLPASAWQLEFVRLIAFPVAAPLPAKEQWWEFVASERPESSIRTRFTHEDRGGIQGIVLSMTVDPRSVTWLVRPSSDSSDAPGAIATLGPLRDKVDWFVDLLSPWLAQRCPPLQRLAFTGKLLQAATTQQQAFDTLTRYLPENGLLDPNPNDFLLQINRRAKSEVVVGLELNRVRTWSKLNIVFAVEPGKPFTWPEPCYSALELDVNTAPEWQGPLPGQLLTRLFAEMASLAVRIAERGETADE